MEDVLQKPTTTVTRKWYPEGDLAVIYKMGNSLVFYSAGNDPLFRKGQDITEDEYKASAPYKCIPYYPKNLPRLNRQLTVF